MADCLSTPVRSGSGYGPYWFNFGSTFKNQGDCVSYVATKGKNQPSAALDPPSPRV